MLNLQNNRNNHSPERQESPLPSTSRQHLNSKNQNQPEVQSLESKPYIINPYNKEIPESTENKFVIPWCKTIDQYVLPPRISLPENLNAGLKKRLDIHTLLTTCRALDEDHHFRRSRLNPSKNKYCSLIFLFYLVLLILGMGLFLGMYIYLSKEALFFYSAIAIGGIFSLSILFRFAVLSYQRKNYMRQRQKQYQKIADKLNREVHSQKGFRVDIGKFGDWLEFTDLTNAKMVPQQSDKNTKKEQQERVEKDPKFRINPRDEHQNFKNFQGMIPSPRQAPFYTNPKLQHSPHFYRNFDLSTASKTHHTLTPMQKSQQELMDIQSSPIYAQNIHFQSLNQPSYYETGLPPSNPINYEEIRLSRISQLKKPNLKTVNYDLNSIEEEDISDDNQWNARFSASPHPEYFYSYKDRVVDAKTNQSVIVRSPGSRRQLTNYRSSENIDPNLPNMIGGQIHRPPPTSPKQGRNFHSPLADSHGRQQKRHPPVVYMVKNAHRRNQFQGERKEVHYLGEDFSSFGRGNLAMRKKMLNGKMINLR